MTELTITRPDDWHVHLRDGVSLAHTCADMARYFGRAIVMPNLSPDNGMGCCALPIWESGPDLDYYYIDMDFNVAWSDDLDRISVSGRHVLLHVEGEEDGLRAFARISYLPMAEIVGHSISARRPNDWPDETSQAFLNNLWMVPAGTTSARLVIGEEEADQFEIILNLDIPVSEMMRPLETASITLDSLTTEDAMSRDRRITGGELTITMQPTIGRLTRLDVTLLPLISTDTDNDVGENSFYFFNTYFSLISPEGIPLAPLGQDIGGSLVNDHSNSMSWDDEPSSTDRSLYFLGAGTPGTYQVYYLSDRVGEITLQ